MVKLIPTAIIILSILLLLEPDQTLAKKSSRRPSAATRRPSRPSSRKPPVSRRRKYEREEEDDEDDVPDVMGFDDEEDEEEEVDDAEEEEEDDDEEDFPDIPPKRKGPSRRPAPRKQPARKPSRGPPRKPRVEEESDYEDDYDRPRRKAQRGPPRSGRRPRAKSGSVVRYSKPKQGSAFTRGLSAIRNSMPDPATIRDVTFSSINAARETTSSLSATIYREMKGLTSSELEQVMLKATKPDDTPVKGKHVERLVGVTYQISSRYDIYDAVLRKLWGKMVEKDWRTNLKAIYILHRFSADGAPEHAAALKARLRELRRTRDPKRKDKYFNSKQLLAGDSKPENIKFRAFMSRYAHYVLLRTQCFGGMFDEISALPKPDKKKGPKPITSTSLRVEHMDAAQMLLKAGLACQLKDGEECENTAIAAERVVADLIGLTAAIAVSLNRALKAENLMGADPVLLKKWCVFYSEEMLPKTKAVMKKTSKKLDAYGLFLPSRMGTSVTQELLDRGLALEEKEASSESSAEPSESVKPEEEKEEQGDANEKVEEDDEEEEDVEEEPKSKTEPVGDEDAAEEEYEYDEEEYYDEED